LLIGEGNGFDPFETVATAPVRLIENEVDVLDVEWLRSCLSSSP